MHSAITFVSSPGFPLLPTKQNNNKKKVPIDKSLIQRNFIHEYHKCQQMHTPSFLPLFIKYTDIQTYAL